MIIGIDLGTTYSAAAYLDHNGLPRIIPNKEGEDTTPSVVSFEDGNIVVGSQAKENCVFSPFDVQFKIKQYMGNKSYKFITTSDTSYTAEEISAIILKRVIADSEAYLGEKVEGAVITVPAYFGDAERKATVDAGEIAGIKVLGLINEPTAAAIAFGMNRKQSGLTIMVYDLGGGTFDVTILRIEGNEFRVLATHGDKELGGSNFDNELINYSNQCIRSELGVEPTEDDELQQELRIKCEKVKKSLSSSLEASFMLSIAGKRLKITISKSEFEDMIASLIRSTENSMDIAMEDAGLTPREIDKVLLVGGSTRIPAIRTFIEEKMHIVPSSEVHPDQAVAIGAAYYANELRVSMNNDSASNDSTSIPQTKLHDVNSHGLGIAAKNENNEMENCIILPRNTELPAKYQRVFSTSIDNQTQISLIITEGDDTDLKFVTKIGEALISIPPHPKGSPVCIEMAIDSDGLIHVYVIDMFDGVTVGEAQIDRSANMTDEDVQNKKNKMAQIDVK